MRTFAFLISYFYKTNEGDRMRQFIDVQSCLEMGAKGMERAEVFMEDGWKFNIEFRQQKTGYGERVYLVCPKCGHRRMKLYIFGGRLLCRECYSYPVYRRIKNVSQGGYKYIIYRMCRFAEYAEIKIKRLPFYYGDYERSKYKHRKKWEKSLKVLQALENMRVQSVVWGKRFSVAVVNSVLKGENSLLNVYDLDDLTIYAVDWEDGI